MARTVEINEDILINLCWDRIENFKQAKSFGDDFWNEIFDFLSETGWLKAQYNDPAYIVDNIVYNGEILDFDECKDNFDEIESDYDGNVEEWASDEGYLIFDDKVVINLGL